MKYKKIPIQAIITGILTVLSVITAISLQVYGRSQGLHGLKEITIGIYLYILSGFFLGITLFVYFLSPQKKKKKEREAEQPD